MKRGCTVKGTFLSVPKAKGNGLQQKQGVADETIFLQLDPR